MAIGASALGDDDVGGHNTAVGFEALKNQNFSTSTDSQNTALGY